MGSRLRLRPLPSVSSQRLWFANPTNAQTFRSSLLRLRSGFTFLGASFALSAAFIVFWYLPLQMQNAVELEETLRDELGAEVSSKVEALATKRIFTDQKMVNNLCTDWWFGKSGAKRTPPKPTK